MTFQEKFLNLAAERTPFCVGIDPSKEMLKAWGLTPDVAGLKTFCARLLEAADGQVSVFKPQCAFFEQFGPDGMSELVRLGKSIREQGSLFLLDCKRSDMGSTMTAYAEAFLGEDSPFHVDALTVVPFLGFDSLLPVLTRAVKVGAGVFVVVRSSNPEGGDLQRAFIKSGLTVANHVAQEITAFNARQGEGIGAIGAVMGATIEEQDELILANLPRSVLLVPGVGAQGATLDDVAKAFGPAVTRCIVSVSRGVAQAGPSVSSLRETIKRYQHDSARIMLVAQRRAAESEPASRSAKS